jgi:hypothetical protein
MPLRVAITQQAGFRKQYAHRYSRNVFDGNGEWLLLPGEERPFGTFCNQCYLNLFDVSRILERCGFPGHFLHGGRLQRVEQVERLERPVVFAGSHVPRGLKQRIRKFSQERLFLLTAC